MIYVLLFSFLYFSEKLNKIKLMVQDQAIIFFSGLIGIVIAIFYLLNLQNLLKECSLDNQQIPPGNVWLMLIPLFNIVFQFIMYQKISESIKREFESRGRPQSGDYLKSIGLAMSILTICSIVPILGGLCSIANLVLFIMYWVKSNGFKNQLAILPKDYKGVKISDNPSILD